MSLSNQEKAAPSAVCDRSAIKLNLVLVMHQIFATVGVLVWAGLLTNTFLGIPRIWGHVFLLRDVNRILLAAPYYPVQIIVGLFWGWLIWTRFQHREMFWVWVFPLLTLFLGILGESTRTSSILEPSILSRFFGTGCHVEDHCFAQIGFVLPFYAAVSYALGGWLALRFSTRSRFIDRIEFWALITIGVIIFGDTVVGHIEYIGRTWWWVVILAGVFEALMGASLIVFALRKPRIDNKPT